MCYNGLLVSSKIFLACATIEAIAMNAMNKKIFWKGFTITVIGLLVIAVAGTAGIIVEVAFLGLVLFAIGIVTMLASLGFIDWLFRQ